MTWVQRMCADESLKIRAHPLYLHQVLLLIGWYEQVHLHIHLGIAVMDERRPVVVAQ